MEKAFDRVSSKVISKARHKLSIEKWLLSAVMAMHDDAKTMIRTVYCNSEVSGVRVVMHQCSGLSYVLFATVMYAIS